MTPTSTNSPPSLPTSRQPEKKGGRSPREERVIAGFEEIQRFTEKHGRAPQHGEDRDIFERLYAVRLDRLRALPDCRALLEPLDHQGLLAAAPSRCRFGGGIHRHRRPGRRAGGRSRAQTTSGCCAMSAPAPTSAPPRRSRIASRATDFEAFKPLFERVATEVKTGLRQSQPIAGRPPRD